MIHLFINQAIPDIQDDHRRSAHLAWTGPLPASPVGLFYFNIRAAAKATWKSSSVSGLARNLPTHGEAVDPQPLKS